jgi:phenylalanine-4-hydroxylase
VLQVQRGADKRLLVIKWTDCTATRGDKIYFQPEWGEFDMAVGDGVVSVYGGPADREAYGSYDVGQATTTPGRRSPYTEAEKAVFTRYQEVRDARAQRTVDKVRIIAERAARDMPAQWLLRLECLEVLKQQAPASLAPFVREYEAALLADAERLGSDARWLVKQGVALATVPD